MYHMSITLNRIHDTINIKITNKKDILLEYSLYECVLTLKDYNKLLYDNSLLVTLYNGNISIKFCNLKKSFTMSIHEINCGVKLNFEIILSDKENKQFKREIEKLYKLKSIVM